MKLLTKGLSLVSVLVSLTLLGNATKVNAAIIQLDLRGTAGSGLLPGNEPGSVIGGTGGEIGAGITYDTSTNELFIANVVGWGSSQGFTDLSSTVTASHLHGPTASANGNGFIETAGVAFALTRSSDAVTGGVFTDTPFVLTDTQEIQLLEERFYINIHTVNNPGGELRGFLTVPEPLTMLGAGAAITFGAAFKRRKAQ